MDVQLSSRFVTSIKHWWIQSRHSYPLTTRTKTEIQIKFQVVLHPWQVKSTLIKNGSSNSNDVRIINNKKITINPRNHRKWNKEDAKRSWPTLSSYYRVMDALNFFSLKLALLLLAHWLVLFWDSAALLVLHVISMGTNGIGKKRE